MRSWNVKYLFQTTATATTLRTRRVQSWRPGRIPSVRSAIFTEPIASPSPFPSPWTGRKQQQGTKPPFLKHSRQRTQPLSTAPPRGRRSMRWTNFHHNLISSCLNKKVEAVVRHKLDLYAQVTGLTGVSTSLEGVPKQVLQISRLYIRLNIVLPSSRFVSPFCSCFFCFFLIPFIWKKESTGIHVPRKWEQAGHGDGLQVKNCWAGL